MRLSFPLATLAFLANTSSALPAETFRHISARQSNTTDPASINGCAEIAALFQTYDPSSGPFQFPGVLADECLYSMPFEAEKATNFANTLSTLMQFDSTADILRAPPPGYPGEIAVDLIAEMKRIAEGARLRKYSSHYAFESAIMNVLMTARDFHLAPAGLCSFSTFQYSRGVDLVSASPNGIDLPKIYTLEDAMRLSEDAGANVTAIRRINGQRPESFLEGLSSTQPYLDSHSRYNMMFATVSTMPNAQGPAAFSRSSTYPGANTEIEWTNGTYKRLPTMAALVTPSPKTGGNFNFTSGREFYESFCLPPVPNAADLVSTPQPTQSEPEPESTPLSAAYSTPIVKSKNNHIVGFYPRSIPDTAVLACPSFMDDSETALYEFGNLSRKFVHGAVTDGKQRIIVDLTRNGGGMTSLAYSLFALFFPDQTPVVSSTFRTHEGAKAIADFWELAAADKTSPASERAQTGGTSFDRFGSIKPDQEADFASLNDFYGPQVLLNGNFSAYFAENFATSIPSVAGYGPNREQLLPSQPFQSKNILLVTDGTCGSSCNTFVQLMRRQSGVKVVSLGGTSTTGPMEAVGGSKGAQKLPYSWFNMFAKTVEVQKVNGTSQIPRDLETSIKQSVPPHSSKLPFTMDLQTGVNSRNSYGSASEATPLQFISQPANCRLFYTPAMLVKPEAAWTSVYDAWWGPGICVAGSNL